MRTANYQHRTARRIRTFIWHVKSVRFCRYTMAVYYARWYQYYTYRLRIQPDISAIPIFQVLLPCKFYHFRYKSHKFATTFYTNPVPLHLGHVVWIYLCWFTSQTTAVPFTHLLHFCGFLPFLIFMRFRRGSNPPYEIDNLMCSPLTLRKHVLNYW